MKEHEELAALSAAIARRIQDAPARPKLRLITAADLPPKPARTLSDEERVEKCEDIRIWCGVYPIEAYVRRHMRGYAAPEDMTDDDLERAHAFAHRCVQAIRDEVPFDEAGIV